MAAINPLAKRRFLSGELSASTTRLDRHAKYVVASGGIDAETPPIADQPRTSENDTPGFYCNFPGYAVAPDECFLAASILAGTMTVQVTLETGILDCYRGCG